ncbi:hypothetical protein GGS23DRAFT_483093 [Durotheca rogersii]|uniref:uncharacterized protein n=1 Tax=Durotheca rogersii TaxID=419775 RepID=UPI00221EDEA5|nr:uncharacterized protein GGS23DRAFT_483093 [Durotheca rogersii]KAI5864114.1 hypothetical protein GGS23DRAFT_483093 [Durotheca rogersii]
MRCADVNACRRLDNGVFVSPRFPAWASEGQSSVVGRLPAQYRLMRRAVSLSTGGAIVHCIQTTRSKATPTRGDKTCPIAGLLASLVRSRDHCAASPRLSVTIAPSRRDGIFAVPSWQRLWCLQPGSCSPLLLPLLAFLIPTYKSLAGHVCCIPICIHDPAMLPEGTGGLWKLRAGGRMSCTYSPPFTSRSLPSRPSSSSLPRFWYLPTSTSRLEPQPGRLSI